MAVGVYIIFFFFCLNQLLNTAKEKKKSADASFQVRTTLSGKYPKLECKLEISQRREDHKGYDNLHFLRYIAEFLETEVKKIRSDKPKPEYRVRTTNLKGNMSAKNYLLQFPLFGTKHLDSLD